MNLNNKISYSSLLLFKSNIEKLVSFIRCNLRILFYIILTLELNNFFEHCEHIFVSI